MNNDNLNKLITEAFAIESTDAKDAGALGFMARALVQATMPHKDPGNVEAWGRRNGDFSMVMQPGYTMDKNNKPQSIGLPYGTKPRLVMAFISSEAVRSRSREIVLGRSLSEFMEQLNLTPTGGRWGTIPMLKEQMRRLFSTTISFRKDGKAAETSAGFRIASKSILFWDTKSPSQEGLWESTVTLSQDFYDEIIERPIPLDMRALAALKGSSLALDIYCWLTYRMSYLNKPTVIPWALLAMQFGSDYASDMQGVRNFKKKFLEQLKTVYAIYDGLQVVGESQGLLLRPAKTHVRKKIIVDP